MTRKEQGEDSWDVLLLVRKHLGDKLKQMKSITEGYLPKAEGCRFTTVPRQNSSSKGRGELSSRTSHQNSEAVRAPQGP